MCTHATLWLKPPAPTTTRRRPAASASGLGVAGVASASATGGDQATPATSLPLAEQSFNSSLDPTRPPDHEPADAMLMYTSLPAKSSARKGQRRSWPGPGAARLSVQGSEETKTRVDEGNKPCSAEVSLLVFSSLSTGGYGDPWTHVHKT